MQVKKFEARTIKEALVLVKQELGPEAIILSAKDSSKGFGLMGGQSVEVTAAVSELTLKKKHHAERKLPNHMKEKFVSGSARMQKQYIESVFEKTMEKNVRPKMTETQYIDINEDENGGVDAREPQAPARTPSPAYPPVAVENRTKTRIREAAQTLRTNPEVSALFTAAENKANAKAQAVKTAAATGEIEYLRKEINYLRGVIENFQKVPQNFITMHPGASEGISFELSFMFEKLVRAGVSSDNAVEILKRAKEFMSPEQMKRPALVDAWVAKYILDTISICENRLSARYQLFIGPMGQGKTSSLIKMASHLVIVEKKKVAIVTTDSAKVGASEQLKILAQILNIPFAVVKQSEDWDFIESQLKDYDYILVDFPGLGLKSIEEIDFVRYLLPPKEFSLQVHFVISVLAKDSDAFEIAQRYRMFNFNDVIFTGLDESAQHGIILNFQKKFNVPIHSFGIGPRIPEDFEAATKERVVDLLFKLSRIKKEG